jgi:hypothetical protein
MALFGTCGTGCVLVALKSVLLLLLLLVVVVVVVVVVLLITIMQGIYTYIPETNHVSRVYSVAVIL